MTSLTTLTTDVIVRRFALASILAVAPLAGVGCIGEAPEELANESEVEAVESPEPVDQNDEAATSDTVAQAVTSSCATSSVKGLSQQIIDEARCIDGGSYVKITKLGNVTFGSSVFPYLEKPAADKLAAALKANSGKSFTINSALRTVAQQYLLYRWYQTGRCGIGLAAKPGASNHETGLALDVSQYSTWKPILAKYGFNWLGSGDPVHFDYAGAGAVSHKGLDVKAFQRLWNRNNPNDKIDADGAWGPQTEARMKKAPAKGFAKGATCGTAIQATPDGEELNVRLPEGEFDGFPLVPVPAESEAPVAESCSDHDHGAL